MTAATERSARLDADMARVGDGDAAALARVYAATSARIFGICLRLTGDRAMAEEAAQEAYLRVWRRAARFDPARAAAITWMSLIARSAAIDLLRGAGRSAAAHDRAADHDAVVAPHAPVAGAGALSDCMDELAEDARITIRSAYFDGYSYAELAATAAVPLPTMKSRIRRALAQLRRCLEDV